MAPTQTIFNTDKKTPGADSAPPPPPVAVIGLRDPRVLSDAPEERLGRGMEGRGFELRRAGASSFFPVFAFLCRNVEFLPNTRITSQPDRSNRQVLIKAMDAAPTSSLLFLLKDDSNWAVKPTMCRCRGDNYAI